MRGVIFPSTVGLVCAVLRTGLGGVFTDEFTDEFGNPVTVQPDLPSKKTGYMVTVRDDSGPDDGVQTRRRHGVNVWADSAVGAENLALFCMALMRSCADGKPITLVDQLAGPFRVDDDPQLTVGKKNLSHYFFTCRVSARGSNL